jgi:hypothetical protein
MHPETLKQVMKFHLRNFNLQQLAVTDDTVHNAILSNNDGMGGASSQQIYRSLIHWTLLQKDCDSVQWPVDWMSWSVDLLAEKLVGYGH